MPCAFSRTGRTKLWQSVLACSSMSSYGNMILEQFQVCSVLQPRHCAQQMPQCRQSLSMRGHTFQRASPVAFFRGIFFRSRLRVSHGIAVSVEFRLALTMPTAACCPDIATSVAEWKRGQGWSPRHQCRRAETHQFTSFFRHLLWFDFFVCQRKLSLLMAIFIHILNFKVFQDIMFLVKKCTVSEQFEQTSPSPLTNSRCLKVTLTVWTWAS